MYNEQNTIEISRQEMVEKYFDMVFRLALSQTKSRDFSDEVVQDVFLRFLKQDKPFESEEHIKAWLIRVTINCSKSMFTNTWFKRTEGLDENMEIAFEDKEESDVFYATQELPPKYRAVIHLFYYEDMSVEKIAETLDLKESTVKSQLHRAREMLREKLKRGYDFV